MNKVLVKLYVPTMNLNYDVWIPINKSIYSIIVTFVKTINEISQGCYKPQEMPFLYDRITGEKFDIKANVKDAGIKNGTEIILI